MSTISDPGIVDDPATAPEPGLTSDAARRRITLAVGLLVLVLALWWLAGIAEWAQVLAGARALLADPAPVALALVAYALAFAVRATAWTRLQPAVSWGQAWAAIHVGLAGNHVLPLRLGEALRVVSAVRRSRVPVRETTAVTVTLRLGDMLALLVIAAIAAPVALGGVLGTGPALALGAVLAVGIAVAWMAARGGSAIDVPTRERFGVVAATAGAWLLEAAVLYAVAGAAGLALTPGEAAGVTAVTIFAQVIAITPGGIGTYEAAGTAALVALGLPADRAFTVVLLTHAVKTLYSLAVGALAVFLPGPGYFGRWRLPRHLPARPPAVVAAPDAPVVVFLPAHNEAAVIGEVLRRIPAVVHDRRVEVIVVDDASTDDSAAIAEATGARVVRHPANRGLGAAVRTGLAEAAARGPAAAVYLDSDGEYRPEDIAAVVAPVLAGGADYVVGSRFTGRIDRMLPHRRAGNRVLTRWVRWMTRRRDLTDGQSGFRAFSPAAVAAAEVIHAYNYAQVLTLDLLGKGFTYAEVPIGYAFRTSGTSFVSLGRYLRKVIPATHAVLNRV